MVTNETPRAESTAQFASSIFSELRQIILEQEPGALAGEVEAIHDMRVGVRRLRVALSNFAACLSKEERRRRRQHSQHLADALGKVRDLDVLIVALEAKQPTRSASERQAVKAILRRLRARRRHHQRRLVAFLNSAEYVHLKRALMQDTTTAAPRHEEERHGQAA